MFFLVPPRTLVLEVVLILMFNAITEYQLHDEGMQKMRPYRKLSLLKSVNCVYLPI